MRKVTGILAIVGVAVFIAGYVVTGEQNNTKTYVQENLLTIPPLIDSREVNNDIELVIQNGEHEFFSGIKSITKGFSQFYLGPTIRLYQGTQTRITYKNDIDDPITVHGHGLHVEGKVDGGPQSQILPTQRKSFLLPIVQEAGTSWYHPHLMGKTAEHVHAGLAGLYIIEDENSQTLPLPKNYGINDIPLVVQDRSFINGKMKPYTVTSEQMTDGLREETLVVNGTINPYHLVPAGWVRLRLLNGSNARFYRFFFADNAPFYKIATEGGFLNQPVTMTEITMAPGERNEIMIDLSNHTSLSLRAAFLPPDPEGESVIEALFSSDPSVQRVVDLRVDKALSAQGTLPDKLNEIDDYSQIDMRTAVRRTLTMNMANDNATVNPHNMFAINGQSMNMNVINVRVKKGDLELWTVTGDEMPHPFHVHGVSFQILTHNGEPPAEEDRGWKDTVVVTEEPTEILMRFHHTATQAFPFMYHCHILEHEDGGMMGQFTVLD
ncbi:MAG: multicopper oxidase domain-containing protein [Pseudomonadota bacterium]